MTPTDHKLLFTALAFLAVAQKGKDTDVNEDAESISKLATLIGAYCEEHVLRPAAMPALDLAEDDVTTIDALIERHVAELRNHEVTHLPEDRDILLQLYDRLQLRHTRREQREIYASAAEDELADLVLRYLDDEINDVKKRSLM